HLVRGLRRRRVGQVRQRREQLLQLALGRARALPESLDLARQGLQSPELRRDVALLALAERDLLGERLLRSPQALGGLRRLAPLLVELDEPVDARGEVRAAPRQRRANQGGLATDQPEVQHNGAAVRLSAAFGDVVGPALARAARRRLGLDLRARV